MEANGKELRHKSKPVKYVNKTMEKKLQRVEWESTNKYLIDFTCIYTCMQFKPIVVADLSNQFCNHIHKQRCKCIDS